MRWLVFFLFIFNGLLLSWFMLGNGQENSVPEEHQVQAFDYAASAGIQLLSEMPEGQLLSRDIRASTPVLPVMPVGGVVGPGCLLAGPFMEVISVRQARSRLGERGVSSRSVMVLKELPSVNWVYIAPQSDRKKALALLKDLQAKNIDSFLIADGEYENGISLGFFSNLESAKAVMMERAKEGYPVSLAEKKREQKTYWLSFDESTSSKIDDQILRGLEESGMTLKRQEKSCAEVALLPIFE